MKTSTKFLPKIVASVSLEKQSLLDFNFSAQYFFTERTLVSLIVNSKQFTKLHLPGGLYEIPIRTGFDLDRKIFLRALSLFMQKICFQLHETEI